MPNLWELENRCKILAEIKSEKHQNQSVKSKKSIPLTFNVERQFYVRFAGLVLDVAGVSAAVFGLVILQENVLKWNNISVFSQILNISVVPFLIPQHNF